VVEKLCIHKVLVSGATGYVGGRLVPRLLEAGYQVRVLVRDRVRLGGRSWIDQVEVVQGDALIAKSLAPAMDGVDAAYYLIHSMGSSTDFHQRDINAARNFSQAAKLARIKRIIYLGGLGDPTTNLSEHLSSRQQTGEVLREGGVPVIEFRAAMIVGSGSASFEMMRYMAEVMPVMLSPKWVHTRVQPISVRNVLDYLVAALHLAECQPEYQGEIIEIGGTEILTYREMLVGYARMRGLRRFILPLPFLSPRFCSLWLHWLTPIPAPTVRPLIDGLRNEVVVRDDKARTYFPDIVPRDYETSLKHALARVEAAQVETSWSDALATTLGDLKPVTLTTREGLILERRQIEVAARPEVVSGIFFRLGGKHGWLYANWLWVLRGVLDRLIGGVGFRRGRRHPDTLRVGDAVDFWRVEAMEPGRLLRLRAEMKLPGLAWLEFEARPKAPGRTVLVQTAFFEPKGFSGIMYWYVLYPIHRVIFAGLVRRIAQQSEIFGNVPSPTGHPAARQASGR